MPLSTVVSGVFGVSLLASGPASASPSKVAILATEETPIAARLERNVTAMGLEVVTHAVAAGGRAAVTRLLDILDAGSALCTDGDAVGVWILDGDHVRLKDVVVSTTADPRGQEVTAAKASMALRASLANKDAPPLSVTIVAHGPDAGVFPNSATPEPSKDAPPPSPPPRPSPRLAPRLVLAVGPAAMASRHGTSLALTASAEIGFSRTAAIVPWIAFIPANRVAETAAGSASFRPTTFGLGVSLPFTDPSSRFVPRLGGGYAMVWMHVSPETATPPAAARKPEDLLAPGAYLTGSLSLRLTSSFRIAAEAIGGVATHQMVVRIARESAAHWGVPFGSLGLRGEWVQP